VSNLPEEKWSCADKYNRPGNYITSDEGKILQKAMWAEVIDVLEEKIPRVKDVIASLPERRALTESMMCDMDF
jgi:hypothetical protein